MVPRMRKCIITRSDPGSSRSCPRPAEQSALHAPCTPPPDALVQATLESSSWDEFQDSSSLDISKEAKAKAFRQVEPEDEGNEDFFKANFSAGIVVSNAGVASLNGLYKYSMMFKGWPLFTAAGAPPDTGLEIWRNFGQWRMGKAHDYYYMSVAVDPVSPCWQVYASDDGRNTYRNAAAVGTSHPRVRHEGADAVRFRRMLLCNALCILLLFCRLVSACGRPQWAVGDSLGVSQPTSSAKPTQNRMALVWSARRHFYLEARVWRCCCYLAELARISMTLYAARRGTGIKT